MLLQVVDDPLLLLATRCVHFPIGLVSEYRGSAHRLEVGYGREHSLPEIVNIVVYRPFRAS